MDKREIMSEAKAVQKAILGLKKKFEKERTRIEKLDDKATEKRNTLQSKRNETTDEAKRLKLSQQMDALPDYDGPLNTIGHSDDDFDTSILGAINAMDHEIESIVKKDGFIDQFFKDMEIAESPAEEQG